MGKSIAEQECAHIIKYGIRLLLLGIPPKLILVSNKKFNLNKLNLNLNEKNPYELFLMYRFSENDPRYLDSCIV